MARVVEVAAKSLMLLARVIRGRATRCEEDCILVLEYLLPLGCCVHLTPVYEAIKRTRPSVTIVVATRGTGAALLRHNGYVDHVLVTPDPLRHTVTASMALRRMLQARDLRPGLTLTGACDRRSRIAFMAFLSASGRRGGYTLVPELYDWPLVYDAERSLLANNLRLAQLAGGSADPVEPRVFFTAEEVEAMQRALRPKEGTNARCDERQLGTVVFVTQSSGGQSTGWHFERFTEVIRYAQEQMGLRSILVGTAADAAAIERLVEATGGGGLSMAGKTSVTELAALLAMSDYVVSIDTGTMHVGRSAGTPMVVLGPSWQRKIEWMPLGQPQVRILRGDDIDRAPAGYQLDEIATADVIAALKELAQLYPASEEARTARLQRSLSVVDHASSRG